MSSPKLLLRLAALFASSLVLSPRVSEAQMYVDLPGTQPGGLASGANLDSARQCGVSCHFLGDASMSTSLPYDGWVSSMMGNAMRDPLFLAALTIAEQDRPGVGDYCLRCHTPPGFMAGNTRGTPEASRGLALQPSDLEGVTCDSCHRMVATTNLGNAQYQLSLDETRFGPYPVVDNIRHPGAVSAWMADSRMCGTCHQITNPAQPQLNADGTDSGRRFPLDTTYAEWANSAFAVTGSADARTCQDCHLPRISGQGYVSTNNTAMLRNMPRRHDFAGANSWALRVLASMRRDVASGDFYDPTVAPFYEAGAQRAESSLRSAVTLELRQVPTRVAPGGMVQVTARLTNLTGHRVPTGYGDGRRMWLEFALVSASGQATVLSGAYDDATAHLTETEPGLRLYSQHAGRAGVGVEEHLAMHNTIVRDTRLPPRGYRPQPGHEPVGVDYSGGENGALRHWDDATWSFPLPAGLTGTVTVRVRARYQTTTREYVEFLANENHTDNRGRDLLRLYEASGRAAPVDMAVAMGTFTVDAPVADAGAADAGGDAGAMTADGGMPRVTGGCACAAPGAPPGAGHRWDLALGSLAIAAVGARRRLGARRRP